MAHTAAPPHDATAQAWLAYRAALSSLEGRAYEEAEALAWAALQEQLEELARVDGVHHL